MISNLVERKIQKENLSSEYKQKFISSLEQIQEKYQSQISNKPLIIKKVCTKYLKICNSSLSALNVTQSRQALQFIKSLQLDIYQGKSYQLYLIRITIHILMIKTYQLSIKNSKFIQEQQSWKKKKQTYLSRLKIFLEEIQNNFFVQLLVKDYYSNIELIMFHVIKHDLETTVEVSNVSNVQTDFILLKLEQITKYVDKLFEILKCHILELNQMLFYLQKKVYELLSVKVKLLIDLFLTQTKLTFIEEICSYFLESSSSLRKLSESQTDKNENTHQNIQKYPEHQKQFCSDVDSYQKCKNKFINENLQHIWEKYDIVFNKIPINVDQNQVFQRAQKIISHYNYYDTIKQSTSSESKSKQNKQRYSQRQQHQNKDENQNQNDQSKSDQDKNDDDQVRSQKSRQTQLSQKDTFKNNVRQIKPINSIYKRQKSKQLQDFMDFYNDKPHHYLNTENTKVNPCNLQLSHNVQLNHSYHSQTKIISQKAFRQNFQIWQQQQQQSNNGIYASNKFVKNHNADQKYNKNKHQVSLNGRNQTSQNKIKLTQNNPKDQIKRSNFGVFKDMQNVFQYMYQKGKMPQNNLNHNKHQNIQLKNHKIYPKDISQINICSEGFKKLLQVKNTNLSSLKLSQANQLERLRRTKSVDIIRLNKNDIQGINKLGKNNCQKKTNNKKSKSVYLPFLGKEEYVERNNQINSQLQKQNNVGDLAGTKQSNKVEINTKNMQTSIKKDRVRLYLVTNNKQNNRNSNHTEQNKQLTQIENNHIQTKQNEAIPHKHQIRIRSRAKKTTLDSINIDAVKLKNLLGWGSLQAYKNQFTNSQVSSNNSKSIDI